MKKTNKTIKVIFISITTILITGWLISCNIPNSPIDLNAEIDTPVTTSTSKTNTTTTAITKTTTTTLTTTKLITTTAPPTMTTISTSSDYHDNIIDSDENDIENNDLETNYNDILPDPVGNIDDLNTTTSAPKITIGQKNALSSAKSYLNFMSFSYQGLIKQLEYEKYSHDEALYGADNCGADWNEQAAKSAESYLEFMAFSRDGLIKQLEYEGFTREQAIYGVEAVGY